MVLDGKMLHASGAAYPCSKRPCRVSLPSSPARFGASPERIACINWSGRVPSRAKMMRRGPDDEVGGGFESSVLSPPVRIVSRKNAHDHWSKIKKSKTPPWQICRRGFRMTTGIILPCAYRWVYVRIQPSAVWERAAEVCGGRRFKRRLSALRYECACHEPRRHRSPTASDRRRIVAGRSLSRVRPPP